MARAQDTNAITVVWKFALPDGGNESSPALAPDGTLYQGSFHGWLCAVSPDGRLKWKFKTGREIRSSPALAPDGTVYFGSRDGKFYALNADGKLKWSFPTGAWVDSSPAIADDGTVYFGSWNKNFYAFTPDGKLKWQFATSNLIVASPAIATDGTIYFGSHDKKFYALTPDGKLKWQFTTGAEIESSPAIGTGGLIYFTSTDGNFYTLNPDGTEVWHLHTGGFCASSPVLDADGNIYLAVNSFHASISKEGKLRWQHPCNVVMDISPAAVASGQIYFSIPYLMIGGWNGKDIWPPLWYFQMRSNLASAPNIDSNGIIYAEDGIHLFALKLINGSPLARSPWPMWRANPQHTGRVQKVD